MEVLNTFWNKVLEEESWKRIGLLFITLLFRVRNSDFYLFFWGM
jgi:hypothetical protein